MPSKSINDDSPTLFPLEMFAQSVNCQTGNGSLPGDSHASHSLPPLEDAITPSTCGQKCLESSGEIIQNGSSQRTFLTERFLERFEIYGKSDIRLMRSTYHPPQWVQLITGDDSGWLPTPTATANHMAPSMRKWRAYRAFQDWAMKLTPELWELMMGYPAGWTDSKDSGMQLSLKSPR